MFIILFTKLCVYISFKFQPFWCFPLLSKWIDFFDNLESLLLLIVISNLLIQNDLFQSLLCSNDKLSVKWSITINWKENHKTYVLLEKKKNTNAQMGLPQTNFRSMPWVCKKKPFSNCFQLIRPTDPHSIGANIFNIQTFSMEFSDWFYKYFISR